MTGVLIMHTPHRAYRDAVLVKFHSKKRPAPVVEADTRTSEF